VCGIVGVVKLSDNAPVPTVDLLEEMGETIAHRGPDGHGTWVSDDGRVGLHHRRLAIVDLTETGAQPMPDTDGVIQVVVNGEIYNYQELKSDLQRKGVKFRSQTDIEVIPHLYKEYAAEAVEMLDGDFSYGVWNSGERKLTLARDRAGVKPLYWTMQNGLFIFASEIKAILAHPLISARLNQKGLYDYLTYLVVPAPDTLFKDINKLCAGQILELDCSGAEPKLEQSFYYRPLPDRSVSKPQDRLDIEVENLFENSVAKRKMSDVPVGVLFSSGVDSTLNAISFAEKGQKNVRSYTVGVEGEYDDFDDDYHRAKEAAKTLGLDHQDIVISEHDLIDMAEKIIWYMDEPIADPVSIPLYFVTKLAKNCGTTVVQAGEGADELFLGYSKYFATEKHYTKYWSKLSYIPRLLLGPLEWCINKLSHPLAGKIADIVRRKRLKLDFFVSSAVGFYELEKETILSKDFKRKFKNYDSSECIKGLYDELREHKNNPSIFDIITFVELNLRLPELLLMRADKLSMANSVEIRVPFLDKDIINRALSLSSEYCMSGGEGKSPLKRILARSMNNDYVYRKKSGFGLPIHEFFKGALGRELKQMILEDEKDLSQLFDCVAILKRISRGPRSINEGFQLWLIYNFILWKKIFKVTV